MSKSKFIIYYLIIFSFFLKVSTSSIVETGLPKSTTISSSRSSTTSTTPSFSTNGAINNVLGELLFNCNFDTSSVLASQCGGIQANVNPSTSLAAFSSNQNEIITNSNPSLTLTDVKSICMLSFGS